MNANRREFLAALLAVGSGAACWWHPGSAAAQPAVGAVSLDRDLEWIEPFEYRQRLVADSCRLPHEQLLAKTLELTQVQSVQRVVRRKASGEAEVLYELPGRSWVEVGMGNLAGPSAWVEAWLQQTCNITHARTQRLQIEVASGEWVDLDLEKAVLTAYGGKVDVGDFSTLATATLLAKSLQRSPARS